MQNATILRLEVKEMAEYVLDPGHWPELPPRHRAFLERALPMLQADARLDGLAAGSSFITGEVDEHSDLDLVVVSLPVAANDVLRTGSDIAQTLAPLLAAFPGDHVGEARARTFLTDRDGNGVS